MSGEAYRPPAGPPRVIHADAALVIADKPAGLLSVPGKGAALVDCLEARLRQCHPDLLLVHRLDRDTSGVMVFARTASAQRHLGLQFEKRGVRKTYRAWVAGRVEGDGGWIDMPLAADWPRRPRQKVDPDGRRAETGWRVIAREGERTLVELTPRTGRSHQLRVHMMELGHTIVGDPLYGAADGGERMLLHSERLCLRHPVGGAWVTFQSACPF